MISIKWIILGIIILIILLIPITDSVPENVITYDQIEPALKTGDLIFFNIHRHSNLFKYLVYKIRSVTITNYSWGHVGMIIRDYDGSLKLLDFNNRSDIETGCRLVDLKTLLIDYTKEYQGHYGIRQLSQPLKNSDVYRFYDNCKNYKFRSFWKLIIIYLMEKIFGHPIFNYADQDEMFCSEFIAELLRYNRVLRTKRQSFCFTPAEFEEEYDRKYLNTKEFSYSRTIPFIIK